MFAERADNTRNRVLGATVANQQKLAAALSPEDNRV
jgi:hypothetical protein